jgi:hypothetical protein
MKYSRKMQNYDGTVATTILLASASVERLINFILNPQDGSRRTIRRYFFQLWIKTVFIGNKPQNKGFLF